jgi:hypothetical protein
MQLRAGVVKPTRRPVFRRTRGFNPIGLTSVIYWSRQLLTQLFVIEPFVMLRNSLLQVSSCAH